MHIKHERDRKKTEHGNTQQRKISTRLSHYPKTKHTKCNVREAKKKRIAPPHIQQRHNKPHKNQNKSALLNLIRKCKKKTTKNRNHTRHFQQYK